MGFRGLAHERGIAQRGRPQDHARDSGLEPGLDAGAIANAAAQLNGQIDARAYRANGIDIDGAAFEGAIEIDAMQPAESGIGEDLRLCRGIVVEDGRGFHFAALQAHAASAFQIDRGKQDHGRHLRKFASSCNPTAWLFSGWNCVPTRLSRPTIAVTAPP